MKSAVRLAVYLSLRLAMTAGGLLPWRFGGHLFAAAGRMAFYLSRRFRRRTLDHLRMALGREQSEHDLSAIGAECFSHLGRTLFEAIKLPKLSREEMARLVVIEGEEIVRSALAEGRGLIFVGGHLGNWELMAAVFASRGYALHVIAAPLYDPRLDGLTVRQRRRLGIETIVRSGGSEATRGILSCLKKREILVILLDQDTRTVDGVFVQFFGMPAYTPTAAAVLSLKHGVPIVSGSIWRDADARHHVAFDPAMQPVAAGSNDRALIYSITQELTSRIEAAVRRHPEQWVWMHRRWKRKPPLAGGDARAQ